MKRILALLIALSLLFSSAAYADGAGDVNVDAGGGGMDAAQGGNSWSPGNDGVRVTIVKESTKRPVTVSVDFANNDNDIDIHFVKKCKVRYVSAQSLIVSTEKYKKYSFANPIPRIISPDGSTNIAAIKTYFGQEGTIQDICGQVGFNFNELISGQYVILLEPIIYLKYNGVMCAMSATEAALFDRLTNGDLKAKMGLATHQNLPLAMFLEQAELGFPAWSGATSGIQSDSDIIQALGLGTIRFSEIPPEETPGGGSADYTYHTDTDVITTVEVYDTSGEGISPDDNASITFRIGGNTYRKPFVTPPGDSTPLWIKWHTPSAPQDIEITVSTTAGRLSASSITARIASLEENTPPDPTPRDPIPGLDTPERFRLPRLPSQPEKKTATWGEWIPWWQENLVWISDLEWVEGTETEPGYWEDNGHYEDKGWWEYDWQSYSASLRAEAVVTPADEVPTAYRHVYNGWTMKSGYGINIQVTTTTSSSGRSDDYTKAQNVMAFFPEFEYQTYNRLLEHRTEGIRPAFQLRVNEWSWAGARSHYTPYWYPDEMRYEPQMAVFDVWTPGGQLYCWVTDHVTIDDGSVYDDWNVVPGLGDHEPF